MKHWASKLMQISKRWLRNSKIMCRACDLISQLTNSRSMYASRRDLFSNRSQLVEKLILRLSQTPKSSSTTANTRLMASPSLLIIKHSNLITHLVRRSRTRSCTGSVSSRSLTLSLTLAPSLFSLMGKLGLERLSRCRACRTLQCKTCSKGVLITGRTINETSQ